MIKPVPTIKLLSMSFILSISISCSDNQAPSVRDFEQKASLQIKLLATSLKKQLIASMQLGGPVAAIETCKIKAPEITNHLNSSDTLKIKRTSLRLRNPNNSADDWEQQVLTNFEQQFSSGTPIQELVYSEKITKGDQTTLRMMRAIPMQAVCLTCHGDRQTMSEGVIHSLQKDYPNDLATEFSIGDIRGAFSVSQTFSN